MATTHALPTPPYPLALQPSQAQTDSRMEPCSRVAANLSFSSLCSFAFRSSCGPTCELQNREEHITNALIAAAFLAHHSTDSVLVVITRYQTENQVEYV